MYTDSEGLTTDGEGRAMHTIKPFTSERELNKWLLEVLPRQGNWSEEEYLWVSEHTNHLVEYTDGYIEILPMPTTRHQVILAMLYLVFHVVVKPMGGKVLFSPLRLRVREGKFREPALLLVKDAADPRKQERFWTGADLTLEVVSRKKSARDLVDKRHEYADAGVPEYWIVNPQKEAITVLKLDGGTYVEHGIFRRGDTATSVVLPGVSVSSVDAVFDAK
jgi:Uma2 family endonuclease